jgi:hypothetical protein
LRTITSTKAKLDGSLWSKCSPSYARFKGRRENRNWVCAHTKQRSIEENEVQGQLVSRARGAFNASRYVSTHDLNVSKIVTE